MTTHHASTLMAVTRVGDVRAGPLLVFLAPKGKVLLVAGAHNAPVRAIALADCAGTLVRLSALHVAGRAMSELVDPLARTVSLTVFLGSVAGAMIWLVGYLSRRATSPASRWRTSPTRPASGVRAAA